METNKTQEPFPIRGTMTSKELREEISHYQAGQWLDVCVTVTGDPAPEGSWVCGECEKDWDEKILFRHNHLGKTLENARTETWTCMKDDGGCGAEAVKWIPTEAPESELPLGVVIRAMHDAIIPEAPESSHWECPSNSRHRMFERVEGIARCAECHTAAAMISTKPEAPELKPCFCGSHDVEYLPNTGCVWCNGCNMNWSPGTVDNDTEAIAAWNHRPIEDELRDENERLKGECEDSNWTLLKQERKKFTAEIKRLRDELENIHNVYLGSQKDSYAIVDMGHMAADALKRSR